MESDDVIIEKIGLILNDTKRPMKERFRALFTLRNLGGEASIRWIEKSFTDSSVLLKHELAYCLGQMQDPFAIPKLESILRDRQEDPVVRHEAGEALAAIGSKTSLQILKKFVDDPSVEVAETCQLAVEKLMLGPQEIRDQKNSFLSVDPAPPMSTNESLKSLEAILLDESLPLFARYRAIFSLRNENTAEAAVCLAKGLKCKSALFRHEIAYVLGQMQNPACEEQLAEALRDVKEHEMVRHECAEALGSIASENCIKILSPFLTDERRIVRESCEVALDMCEYENSTEFQFAESLLSSRMNDCDLHV